jgi:hypothetical protein
VIATIAVAIAIVVITKRMVLSRTDEARRRGLDHPGAEGLSRV